MSFISYIPRIRFVILFCAFCFNLCTYHYRIIKTPVFHFTKYVKQHHIVIVQDIHSKKPGLYAIDFTPEKQNNWKTLLQLLFGMNVPANIRVKYIYGSVTLEDCDEKIQDYWTRSSIPLDPPQKYIPVDKIKRDSEYRWKDPGYMNLYTHNCQHFSYDFTRLLDNL